MLFTHFLSLSLSLNPFDSDTPYRQEHINKQHHMYRNDGTKNSQKNPNRHLCAPQHAMLFKCERIFQERTAYSHRKKKQTFYIQMYLLKVFHLFIHFVCARGGLSYQSATSNVAPLLIGDLQRSKGHFLHSEPIERQIRS